MFGSVAGYLCSSTNHRELSRYSIYVLFLDMSHFRPHISLDNQREDGSFHLGWHHVVFHCRVVCAGVKKQQGTSHRVSSSSTKSQFLGNIIEIPVRFCAYSKARLQYHTELQRGASQLGGNHLPAAALPPGWETPQLCGMLNDGRLAAPEMEDCETFPLDGMGHTSGKHRL